MLLLPQSILELLGEQFCHVSRKGELAGGQEKSAWAVAPLRGERNGNKIVIDVPGKCFVLIQD